MRAAVYHGPGDVRIEQRADPVPGPGELLLQVTVVGICGTDAHEYVEGPSTYPVHTPHAVTGHLGPLVPGHELAGTVLGRGTDVIGFADGALVVSGAGISCGQCRWCRDGRTNLCEQYSTVGLNRDGGLAEYVVVPAATCVLAGDYAVSGDWAALGQPMSIAVHAMRQGRLRPGETAVILGAGGIGAFLTYAVSQTTEHVVVGDLDPERLAIARDLGAEHAVLVAERSIADVLSEQDLVPAVIYEVSGSRAGVEDALAFAPRGARVVLVGLQSSSLSLALRDVSVRELELLGTNAHAVGLDLPEAMRLLATRRAGWADVAPVAITLEDLVEHGLRPLAEHRAPHIKTLVDPRASIGRATH